MSASGHSPPRHPDPIATNVRYASNSNQILRRRRNTELPRHADVRAINIAAVECYAQLDVRIFRLKRHYFQPAERDWHIDAQGTGRLELCRLQHLLRLFELRQRLTATLEIRRS